MFISIACGAISGFHATQSPMMARCMKNERLGRRVFYGAMITEGLVALIWAAAGMAFFGGVAELNSVMNDHQGNAAWVVNEISHSLLGKIGGILALLGVVAAPITSGDTAFRSARLIVADFLKLNQKYIKNRLVISIPLFLAGFLLTQLDFAVIWRYFAWSNQTLAAIVLWTVTVYLANESKVLLDIPDTGSFYDLGYPYLYLCRPGRISSSRSYRICNWNRQCPGARFRVYHPGFRKKSCLLAVNFISQFVATHRVILQFHGRSAFIDKDCPDLIPFPGITDNVSF